MGDPYDLTGMRSPRLTWAERLGVAPAGGLLTATPSSSAGEFSALVVSAHADHKGLYVVAAGAGTTNTTDRTLFTVATSGLINSSPVVLSGGEVARVGLGSVNSVARSGRLTALPTGSGVALYSANATAVPNPIVVFAAPLYVPAGSAAALIVATANVAFPLSIAWLELP